MPRHFLGQSDLTPQTIRGLFERTTVMKGARFSNALLGRTLVMFFEKASTRTRLSFEIGMTQLGGHAVYLDRESSQASRGESVSDLARVVSRYADLIMARVYAHRTVTELAEYASIPVINGLSDAEHPCQSLTDLFTMLECKGRLEGLKIAYLGDGDNNVAHSLMLGAAQVGAHLWIASPGELRPDSRFVDMARHLSERFGGSVSITERVQQAVEDADVLYTDVWVSMGQEGEGDRRLELLQPYQVNRQTVSGAKPDFVFMHCLPAHIGEEVTAEVAYGPHSVIFAQAENRLHVQKALMVYLFESSQGGE
jgi:ornithine carbamoyltransferase